MTEVESIENLHRAAQARLGIAAGLIARSEWKAISASNPTVSTSWLLIILRLILGMRAISRRMAIRAYRLSRAIETGQTLGRREGERLVQLDQLRQEFLDVVNEIRELSSDFDVAHARAAFERARTEAAGDPGSWVPAELDEAIEAWRSAWGSDADISVEDFEWLRDAIDSETAADAAFTDYIHEHGDKHLQEMVRRLTATPEKNTPEKVEELHENAGSKVAGVIDKAVSDVGREVVRDAIQRDSRVQMVARGTRGNPCAFCAMLASRGFVYLSRSSAMTTDDAGVISKYHINCHCYPIVRWVDTSQLPESNAYFQKMWPEVTKGHSGREARKAWRRWIERRRRN